MHPGPGAPHPGGCVGGPLGAVAAAARGSGFANPRRPTRLIAIEDSDVGYALAMGAADQSSPSAGHLVPNHGLLIYRQALARPLRLAALWAAIVGEKFLAMPPLARAVATVAAFFIMLVARRPETILRAEFVFEDGKEWYLSAWHLPLSDAILTPYAGYLNFIPRVVGYLERQGPVSLAPLVGNAIALLIVALIAAYVCSDRLSMLIPSRPVRVIVALYLVLLPTTGMTLGSITFIQFYIALFLVAVAVSNPSRTSLQAVATCIAVAAAAATGPFGLVLVPLFVGRLVVRRDRDSAALLTVVGLAAAAQLVTLLTVGRPAAAPPTTDPVAILTILAGHGATVSFGGRPIAKAMESGIPVAWIAALGAATLGLAAIHLRRLPRRWLFVAGYVAAAIIFPALIAGSDETALLLDPLSASRYFVVPGALLGVSLIVALAKRPRYLPTIAMATILAVGIVGDLRLKPNPDFRWSEVSHCIGGEAPCVVPVYPGGPWDITWPGLAVDRIP